MNMSQTQAGWISGSNAAESERMKACLPWPGIDSAKPGSASTQQAFSFGFAADDAPAALDEPAPEEPLPASSPPEAAQEAGHVTEHQQPQVPDQQVSFHKDIMRALST